MAHHTLYLGPFSYVYSDFLSTSTKAGFCWAHCVCSLSAAAYRVSHVHNSKGSIHVHCTAQFLCSIFLYKTKPWNLDSAAACSYSTLCYRTSMVLGSHSHTTMLCWESVILSPGLPECLNGKSCITQMYFVLYIKCPILCQILVQTFDCLTSSYSFFSRQGTLTM